MRYAIGVDIGGGSTKLGLVSQDGKILASSRLGALPDETGDDFVQRLSVEIASLAGTGCKVAGIGIGYPGPIHPGNLSGGIGNVPGLIDFPLAATLTAATGLPVRLENDATAAALAEARFGAGNGSTRLLMVTAGTGIGVAMVIGGAAMVTSGGCLGDTGHLIVDGHLDRRCRLGCVGCLEAFASAEALDDLAEAEALRHPDGAIAVDASRMGGKADTSTLIRCALDGDATAQATLSDAGKWIGRAVASWIHTFAPDAVVIGGGVMAVGDFLLAPLEAEARRCAMQNYTSGLRFAAASLGNDAGVIGAAVQFFEPALDMGRY